MVRDVQGQVLWPGQGAGPVVSIIEPTLQAPVTLISDRGAEIGRLRAAFAGVRVEFEGLLRDHRSVGDEWVHFQALLTALEEEALWVRASRLIDQRGWPAATAVLQACQELGEIFASAEDELEQDHWRYLKVASHWLYRRLQGQPGPALAGVAKGSVVVAVDLPPVELLLLSPGQLAGLLLTSADPWLAAAANPAGVPVVYGLGDLAQPATAAILPGGRVRLEPPDSLMAELKEEGLWLTGRDGRRWAIWPVEGQPLAGRYQGPWVPGLPLLLASWVDLGGVELLGPGPEPILIDLRPLRAELTHPGGLRLLRQAVAWAKGQGRQVGLAGVGEVAPLAFALELGVDAFAAAALDLLTLRNALAEVSGGGGV